MPVLVRTRLLLPMSRRVSTMVSDTLWAKSPEARLVLMPRIGQKPDNVAVRRALLQGPAEWAFHRGWPTDDHIGPALRFLSHALTFPMTVITVLLHIFSPHYYHSATFYSSVHSTNSASSIAKVAHYADRLLASPRPGVSGGTLTVLCVGARAEATLPHVRLSSNDFSAP